MNTPLNRHKYILLVIGSLFVGSSAAQNCNDLKSKYSSALRCENLVELEQIKTALETNPLNCDQLKLLDVVKSIKGIQQKLSIQKITLIKQKYSHGDINGANKILDEYKSCLSEDELIDIDQYKLDEQEQRIGDNLNLSGSGIKKLNETCFVNNNRLINIDSIANREYGMFKLDNIVNPKTSPKETLFGNANDTLLVIKPLKNSKLELKKLIRVPVYNFDDRDSCVYYTNRNSTDDLFCQCKNNELVHFTFSKDSINAKWRIDEILPDKKRLVVRQINGNSTNFKLFEFEIPDTKKSFKQDGDIKIRLKEISSKTFSKKYAEFKIIKFDSTNGFPAFYSAFSSVSQTYDIFKFDGKNTSDILLGNIDKLKVSNGVIVYSENNQNIINIQNLNSLGNGKRKQIESYEGVFDLSQKQLFYWKRINPNSDFYEWELKIYDLKQNDNFVFQRPFKFISTINNPPLIYAFNWQLICYDLSNMRYLYINASNRIK